MRDLTVYATRDGPNPSYELTATARKVLWIIFGPAPDDPEYAAWWSGRLISVKLMREEGVEPKWAVEPPVPLEEPATPEPTAEAPKPKRVRKKTEAG